MKPKPHEVKWLWNFTYCLTTWNEKFECRKHLKLFCTVETCWINYEQAINIIPSWSTLFLNEHILGRRLKAFKKLRKYILLFHLWSLMIVWHATGGELFEGLQYVREHVTRHLLSNWFGNGMKRFKHTQEKNTKLRENHMKIDEKNFPNFSCFPLKHNGTCNFYVSIMFFPQLSLGMTTKITPNAKFHFSETMRLRIMKESLECSLRFLISRNSLEI